MRLLWEILGWLFVGFAICPLMFLLDGYYWKYQLKKDVKEPNVER